MEALKPIGVPLEIAALHYAQAFKVLEGRSMQADLVFALRVDPF